VTQITAVLFCEAACDYHAILILNGLMIYQNKARVQYISNLYAFSATHRTG